MLSPVAIFGYKRLDLLKKLISSLEENKEVSETDIYIFVDKNLNRKDDEEVRHVREYLKEYSYGNTKFKSVSIHEATEHKGLSNSVISGVTEIIDRYGRVIVLEDDLIVSRYFLYYMNQCLDYYENDDRIWSISGYSPNIDIPSDYDKTVYLSYRASSWGWATWSDRWSRVDWDMKDYKSYKWSLSKRVRFCRGGNDLPSMLRAFMNGKIDSWAVRWCYHQSKFDKMSVTPVRSLVINEGFDEDATHCNEEGEAIFGNISLCQELYDWRCPDLETDKDIVAACKSLNDLTFSIRIRDKIRELKYSGRHRK